MTLPTPAVTHDSTVAPLPRPAVEWRARISSTRPMEAILFERTLPEGQAVLTALIDRRTGELAFVGEALGLAVSEVEELRGIARGGDTEGLAPIELEPARLKLARALLASRVGGRPAPRWLADRADLVGDPTHPASRIEDIFLCAECDAPLPVRWQLARVHTHEHHDGAAPVLCPLCRGVEVPVASLAETWQDRAWLMLAADLPHRALVCAARAEAERAPHGRLDIVRGLAHLRLEQGPQALRFFERAASGKSPDPRLSAWVERARALCKAIAPARTAQQRDLTVPSPMAGHASTRASGPVPLSAHI